MPEDNFKGKVLKGLGWSLLSAFAQRGLRFIFGIFLARLLLPEEFGLMGMLNIFIMVAQTFVDAGFALSLIQKPEISEEDKSSVFFINLLISVLMVFVLYMIAPWASRFLEQPMIKPLMRIMSIVILLNGFYVVQNALLIRAIDFKTQTKITIIALSLSGVIGVVFAVMGFGVWSLVAQQISTSFFMTILLWSRKIWKPSLRFSIKSIKDMAGFGIKILASGLLNTTFENIYPIVIGKLFSPLALGYYTRANQFQQMPSKTIARLVSKVAVPAFSTIQSDPQRVKRVARKAIKTLAFVNFPIMIGMLVAAEPMVVVLVTDKWLPCVQFLQILCIVGLLEPFQFINLNILVAFGESGLYLRIEIAKKILIVINIIIGIKFGLMALVYGQVVISLISYYLNSFYNKRILDYSFFKQVKDLTPYLIVTLVMAIVVYLLNFLNIASPLLLLIMELSLGIIVYIALCHLFKLSAYIEVKGMLYKKLFKS